MMITMSRLLKAITAYLQSTDYMYMCVHRYSGGGWTAWCGNVRQNMLNKDSNSCCAADNASHK